jgi:hypothetical protein
LTAFPTDIYVRDNSIVYINHATNNMAVAVLYVIATCGSFFFSKIRMMGVFGVANLSILLIVDAVKRYAFTPVWCARGDRQCHHLVYFWRSSRHRPFHSHILDEGRLAHPKLPSGKSLLRCSAVHSVME